MHVIAISNQKGGVAKTTTCVSLGACLAETGQMVLLIDLDPQANLTLSLGIKPEDVRHAVDEALLGNTTLVSTSRESSIFGLDIVPANRGLAVLDKVLYGQQGYEFYLKHSLEAMQPGLYDTILIDCPPATNTLTLNALTAADLMIVPAQCEYFAAHSLRQTVELVKLVQEKTNPSLAYRVLVTMFDKRNRISHAVLEQMRLALGDALFQTIIEVDTRLRESPAFGQPITCYAPNTRSALQYRALAKELLTNE
jgi:chromosome partitioning protein